MKRYTHLTSEERTLISHYHDNGISMRRIAQKVGRTVSTISRELSRNSNKVGYNPKTAERRYLSRRCKKSKLDLDEDLKAYVLNGLYEGHSPEMIALRLKRFGDLYIL